ncbi:hypothetical protein FPSE_11482 [Fusarium pseudograminearum CS3096]|uniref:Uncharacterized protein n=1 Tax=Fusarium pseudograminearum (strain CS3096) TaxID=1028729 RepID=K3V627_FUSPC|nr:hypothetical protein FPSE_11482 [Fusarium pseudograminearum CS3096]EKJ68474.1 hypothetical protein FPSE_11482 [Fusarium pseudograminearum CS3096]
MVKYKGSLYDYIADKKKDPGTISIKLRYLGLDAQKIEPRIVIQCEKRVKKTIKKFFAQKHVKEDLSSDFRVLVLDEPPIEVANDDTIDALSDSLPRKTMCGMPITLSRGGRSVSCTLGGVIIIGTEQKRLYGLIAGHPLKRIRGDLSGKQPTYKADRSTSSKAQEKGKNYNSTATSKETSAMPSNPVHSGFMRTSQDDHLRRKLKIGTVVSDNFNISSKNNYDWALIELNQEYALPNAVVRIKQPKESEFEDNHTEIYTHYNEFSPGTTIKQVLVLKYGNPSEAELSLNTSLLVMSSGSEFVDAHDVTMKDGSSLCPGDSGLWVVDAKNGNLYGHVVSVDAFGEAQVMPIQPTLQSIKKQLKAAQVYLATSSAVKQLKVAPEEPSTSTQLWPTATEARPALGPTVSSEEDSLQDRPPWNTTYPYDQGKFFSPLSLSQSDHEVKDFKRHTSSTTVEPLSTLTAKSTKNTNEGYQHPIPDQDSSDPDLLQQSSVECPVINIPPDFDWVPAPEVPEKEDRNPRREDDKPGVQQWLQEQGEESDIRPSMLQQFKSQLRQNYGSWRLNILVTLASFFSFVKHVAIVAGIAVFVAIAGLVSLVFFAVRRFWGWEEQRNNLGDSLSVIVANSPNSVRDPEGGDYDHESNSVRDLEGINYSRASNSDNTERIGTIRRPDARGVDKILTFMRNKTGRNIKGPD